MIRACCLALLLAGCRTRLAGAPEHDWYAFAGPSALPQVGASAGAGRVVRRTDTADWSVEAEYTFQFLDDADFIDDGRPNTGDFRQLRLGFLKTLSPGHRRQAFWGAGLAYMDAAAGDSGEPSILDREGEYYGAYAQLGFVTRLSDEWSVGPEARVFVVGGHGVEIVPQFFWRVVFKF